MQQVAGAFANYTIERELGKGGMATVYLAHDTRHDRQVALKVLRPDVAQSIGAERFLREIQLAAKLSHPHILPLFDSGEANGCLYYVMPNVVSTRRLCPTYFSNSNKPSIAACTFSLGDPSFR